MKKVFSYILVISLLHSNNYMFSKTRSIDQITMNSYTLDNLEGSDDPVDYTSLNTSSGIRANVNQHLQNYIEQHGYDISLAEIGEVLNDHLSTIGIELTGTPSEKVNQLIKIGLITPWEKGRITNLQEKLARGAITLEDPLNKNFFHAMNGTQVVLIGKLLALIVIAAILAITFFAYVALDTMGAFKKRKYKH